MTGGLGFGRVAAVLAVSIAGCTGAPSGTPATNPPTPTPVPTPSSSPTADASPAAASSTAWVTFDSRSWNGGHGFAFQYPGDWREIRVEGRIPLGPIALAAVGIGDFDLGCSDSSSTAGCSGPRWTVPDGGVVLVYGFGVWRDSTEPAPTPGLAPGDAWVDVSGRPAVLAEGQRSLLWRFPGAPEYIEARWGPGIDGRDLIDVSIQSWIWDFLTRQPRPSATPDPSYVGGAAVLDVLRPGWWLLSFHDVEGFPATIAQVYGHGEDGAPLAEGPGRVVLYESASASPAFLDHRIKESRQRGGHPVPVEVNRMPAEVWVDESTGELLLGWVRLGHADVLVANSADYTVETLAIAAEGVGECCG